MTSRCKYRYHADGLFELALPNATHFAQMLPRDVPYAFRRRFRPGNRGEAEFSGRDLALVREHVERQIVW